MGKIKLTLLTVAVSALTLGCAADNAGESAPVDSPSAVPAMEGGTQPEQGIGATETPDQ